MLSKQSTAELIQGLIEIFGLKQNKVATVQPPSRDRYMTRT